MTDTNETPNRDDPQQETQVTPINPATPITDDDDMQSWPPEAIAYIKELRAENKSRRLRLNEVETAQRARDQKLLEEQGEYKKLALGA